MAKTHDKEFFYKYVTSDTALRILSDLTVRWSSPLLFNDPFDTQMELRQGFEADNFELLLWQEIERRVCGSEPLHGDPANLFFRILKAMQQGKLERRFDEIKAAILRESPDGESKRIVSNYHSIVQGLNDHWKTLLHGMRIFCVSEVFDDLLMWAHYSGDHTGAVIKFKCLPALDTALCIAEAVKYNDEIPLLMTYKDLVDYLCGAGRLTERDYFKKQALTKSSHWAYEREWRVVDFEPNPNCKDMFRISRLWPDEVEAVYLGCRMDTEAKEAIRSRLFGVLHHVKIFQASPSRSKFELEFEQVK